MREELEKYEDKIRTLTGDKSPFKVPDNYFEELPTSVLSRIDSIPDFDVRAKTNPFEVPQGYFESIPLAVTDLIAEKKRNRLPAFLRPRLAIPLALAMLLLAFGIFNYFKVQSPPVNNRITANDLIDSPFFYSIDEDLLIDVLAQQKSITKEKDIDDYLIDNHIDITQLENAL